MFSLPNLITALNLFLGCMACIELVEGHYEPALILLAGCLLADFLDGFVARMMGSDSLLGVQLDSLADVVSFGLAPGLMIFKLMESNGTGMYGDTILPYFGLILPVFAAFRLARFNIETTGIPTHFTGLPVPATALFFMGYLGGRNFLPEWMLEDFFLIACSIIFSLLMISRLPIIKVIPGKSWMYKYYPMVIAYLICILSYFAIGMLSLSLLIISHVIISLFLLRNKNQNTSSL